MYSSSALQDERKREEIYGLGTTVLLQDSDPRLR